MASIRHEILIAATPADVWDAARDVGALHTRLVPGFVTDVTMEPGADPPVRIVTFASGAVMRERIVDVDDARRRLAWSIEAQGVAHHNGVLEVLPAPEGATCVVWTADVLPHALKDGFGPAMARGLQAMKAHLEAGVAA